MKVINLNDITRSINIIPRITPEVGEILTVSLINEMTYVEYGPTFSWSFIDDYLNISFLGNTFSTGSKYIIDVNGFNGNLYKGKALIIGTGIVTITTIDGSIITLDSTSITSDGRILDDIQNYNHHQHLLEDDFIYYNINEESNTFILASDK